MWPDRPMAKTFYILYYVSFSFYFNHTIVIFSAFHPLFPVTEQPYCICLNFLKFVSIQVVSLVCGLESPWWLYVNFLHSSHKLLNMFFSNVMINHNRKMNTMKPTIFRQCENINLTDSVLCSFELPHKLMFYSSLNQLIPDHWWDQTIAYTAWSYHASNTCARNYRLAPIFERKSQ